MASADKNPVCKSRDTRNGSLLNRKAPTAKLVKQVAHNTTTRCGRVMYTLPGMSAVKMPNHWTHTHVSSPTSMPCTPSRLHTTWSRLKRNFTSRHSSDA